MNRFVFVFAFIAASAFAQNPFMRFAQEDMTRPVTLPTCATTNWPTSGGGMVPAAPQLSWGIYPVDDFGNRPTAGFSRIDIVIVERDPMPNSSPVPFLISRRGENAHFMAHPYNLAGGMYGIASLASNQWIAVWYRLQADTNGVRTVTARMLTAYDPAGIRSASWSAPRVEISTDDLGARIPSDEVHFIRWAWMSGVPTKFTAAAIAVGDSAVFPADENAAAWYAREAAATMITPRQNPQPKQKQSQPVAGPVMFAKLKPP